MTIYQRASFRRYIRSPAQLKQSGRRPSHEQTELQYFQHSQRHTIQAFLGKSPEGYGQKIGYQDSDGSCKKFFHSKPWQSQDHNKHSSQESDPYSLDISAYQQQSEYG